LIAMSGYFRAGISRAALLVVALATAGCNYGFSGGGGFPSHVRTLFIAPIDNETVVFDIDQQIYREMTERLPRAFGVRLAGERVADAVIRARITRYDDIQQTQPGQQAGAVELVQNQITITMALQIVDLRRNEIIFEGTGLMGRGEYRPEQQQREDAGQIRAIEALIQQIVDRAQSQW
jgi:curli biogenesis system outer membrane secretion channel CsgG